MKLRRIGSRCLALAMLLIVASFVGTAEVQAKAKPAKNSAVSYKDGQYQGKSYGYIGEVPVTVTIKGGKIHTIVVEECQESPEFLAKAKGIVDKIIKAQSVKVDAISGATYTSQAIRQGVEKALKKAEQ